MCSEWALMIAKMKNKRVVIRSAAIIVLAWLMALALIYIVVIKFKILFRH
jgi:hypothetical protein